MSSTLLYYSPNCPKCGDIFSKYNLTNINIVNIHETNNIPTYIKSVPTIVSNNKMYVGNNADLYLQDNSLIESYAIGNPGIELGGFSFLDDNECKYTTHTNYSELT
tara:strand:+ start:108 stop:425 length:318 start_codon:yes stop_codon:yes gene_type:complete